MAADTLYCATCPMIVRVQRSMALACLAAFQALNGCMEDRLAAKPLLQPLLAANDQKKKKQTNHKNEQTQPHKHKKTTHNTNKTTHTASFSTTSISCSRRANMSPSWANPASANPRCST